MRFSLVAFATTILFLGTSYAGRPKPTWVPRLSPRAVARGIQSRFVDDVLQKQDGQIARKVPDGDSSHDPKFVHFECGSTMNATAAQNLLEVHKALHDGYSGSGAPGAKLRARALSSRGEEPITIDVAIHVVTTKVKEGTIAKDAPEKQVKALNEKYEAAGIKFNLIDTTWTANDAWSISENDDDLMAMKKALRKGTYSTLNLYFHTDLAGSVLGTCSMPSDVSDPSAPASVAIDPSIYVDDGCNVNAGTMPGGSIFGYSEGMTAVHETGHWLGLFHVFEGYSCDGDGDLIDDTPPQSMATDGCPAKDGPPQDSCPGDVWEEGMPLPNGVKVGDAMVDSVHNIMDYSTDACYEGFTPMQIRRMRDLWGLYRAGR